MDLTVPALMALLGICGGAVLGAAARGAQMCTLGAIEDASLGGNFTRAKSWALTLAIAVAGSQALDFFGIVDLHQSAYLGARLGLVGLVLGGLLFGLGMALVGTCSFGLLVRAAGGDLRAWVSLIIVAATGYMTLAGITGVLRVALIEPLAVDMSGFHGQGAHDVLGGGIAAQLAVTLTAITGLLIFALSGGALLRRAALLAGAAAIGLAIPFGWLATGYIGADPFDPQRVQSFSYVRPVSQTLMYLMTFSGATVSFGVGAVAGALGGAGVVVAWKRQFRWEAFDDQREMRRHLFGAALMGIGGVLALGCTIGQGLSAMSTLSLGAPVALVSIIAGAIVGLRILVGSPGREILQQLLRPLSAAAYAVLPKRAPPNGRLKD